MKSLHTVEAMRVAARCKLPRMVFDFVDGGAGGESALRRNIRAFESVRLWPRVLTGAVHRTQTVELLGQHYAAPFGIAPIGMANVVRPGTDAALARAAARAGLCYVLSTAATTSIEDIAAVFRGAWFQLYVGSEAAITDGLVERADAAGLPVLVVTADVPAPGKRLRDLENGFIVPLRPGVRMAASVARHPAWLARMVLRGAPRFANLERYTDMKASAASLAERMAAQSSARLDWALLERIRARWPRKLVLKGVLHPEDARRAAECGVDAVVVSNHGGRQLDAAPATLEALDRIRRVVGPGLPLILDGGVRSGEDIARALALGADFVLLGRPFLYSVAALGLEGGPARLIGQLRDEFDRALAQLGCASPAQLRTLPMVERSVVSEILSGGQTPHRRGG